MMDAKGTPTTVRLTPAITDRLDRIANRMQQETELTDLTGGQISRSAVLRLSITKGCDALCKKYKIKEIDNG
jgi:hypothetical protein